VTARGWEDLSNLMMVYEDMGIPVDETVVHEFLHHGEVAEDFAAYIDLYRRYQDDYGIQEILNGKVKPEVFARIYTAAFDERLAVTNLLFDGLQSYFIRYSEEKYITDNWYEFLKLYRKAIVEAANPVQCYQMLVQEKEAQVLAYKEAGFYTRREEELQKRLLGKLKEGTATLDVSMFTEKKDLAENCFLSAKRGFDVQKIVLEEIEDTVTKALEHAFDFMEQAFPNGQEMVVFVTELTLGKEAVMFLAEHVCERYMKYNQELLIGTKKATLLSELNRNEG